MNGDESASTVHFSSFNLERNSDLIMFVFIYVCFYLAKRSLASSSQSEDNNIIKRAEPDLKRKQKPDDTSKNKRSKKKGQKRSKTIGDKKEKSSASELSESDRQLLDRWKDMQKKTKPFIHPIRKHMEEIKALKGQQEGVDEREENLDEKGEEQMSTSGVQYHFTNYVSEKGDGESLKAVKEPAVVDRGPTVMFPQNLLRMSCVQFGFFIKYIYIG